MHMYVNTEYLQGVLDEKSATFWFTILFSLNLSQAGDLVDTQVIDTIISRYSEQERSVPNLAAHQKSASTLSASSHV